MQIRKETEWIVTGNLFGKAKRDAPGDFHRAKDISGIATEQMVFRATVSSLTTSRRRRNWLSSRTAS